jgi:hypothetical protein
MLTGKLRKTSSVESVVLYSIVLRHEALGSYLIRDLGIWKLWPPHTWTETSKCEIKEHPIGFETVMVA